MKTSDLISLLAEDASGVKPLGRSLRLGLIAGVVLSALLFLSTIGVRHNMGAMIETGRVLFKVLATLLLAVIACVLAFRVGRPGAGLRMAALWLLLPLVVVIAAVGVEMSLLPEGQWRQNLVGHHAPFCVFFIPTLAAAPLIGLMSALRQGAPENPTLAGAAAGLAAGGVAAALYAWHCPDDSPLFVATWYGLSIGFVTLVGAGAGSRLLRW
jgi:hypothetical protein